MCGRFTVRSAPNVIAKQFGLSGIQELSPHFNIAPTQMIAAVRAPDGPRELVMLRWGLIPSWATDPVIGNRMTNARSETVASKPSFKKAFQARRCLVVADGFYEWQKLDGKKQPFLIRLKSDQPFGFAGLWERNDKTGKLIESCTIMTTSANEMMAPLHERMPVIIPPEHYGFWLNPEVQDVPELEKLLALTYLIHHRDTEGTEKAIRAKRTRVGRCEIANREDCLDSYFGILCFSVTSVSLW